MHADTASHIKRDVMALSATIAYHVDGISGLHLKGEATEDGQLTIHSITSTLFPLVP
jgi:hypothetical protein